MGNGNGKPREAEVLMAHGSGGKSMHQLVEGFSRLQPETLSFGYLPFLKVAAIADIKPLQEITLVKIQRSG